MEFKSYNRDAASARAEASQTEQPKRPKKSHNRSFLNFLKRKWWLILIILAVAGVIVWLAMGYMNAKNDLANASKNQSTGSESLDIVNKVSKFIKLPDESPTVATVNDANKLNSQEFFKNAQNGDKVLIFSDAGRALLYRPSTGQVIEYSKVDLNSSQSQQ